MENNSGEFVGLESSDNNPNTIRTVTGKYIDVFNLSVDDIDLESIAYGGGHVPRWAGQTRIFYSVLQHQMHVCDILPPSLKKAGLFHDASECLGLLDLPSPIKKRLPDYKKLEHHVMSVVAEKFGFKYPLDPAVKLADQQILRFEWDGLVLQKFQIKEQRPEDVISCFLDKADIILKL